MSNWAACVLATAVPAMVIAVGGAAISADGISCGRCTHLLAIPALETVPEHAFGWSFGAPQPFCQLSADSLLRLDTPPQDYRGVAYRKVLVLAGACAGHGGWVPAADLPGNAPSPKADVRTK